MHMAKIVYKNNVQTPHVLTQTRLTSAHECHLVPVTKESPVLTFKKHVECRYCFL